MILRNLFTKEVYVRLSGDQEFTCTTRCGGLCMWARRFHCAGVPEDASSTEECDPGPLVRRPDLHIRTDQQGEA